MENLTENEQASHDNLTVKQEAYRPKDDSKVTSHDIVRKTV